MMWIAWTRLPGRMTPRNVAYMFSIISNASGVAAPTEENSGVLVTTSLEYDSRPLLASDTFFGVLNQATKRAERG